MFYIKNIYELHSIDQCTFVLYHYIVLYNYIVLYRFPAHHRDLLVLYHCICSISKIFTQLHLIYLILLGKRVLMIEPWKIGTKFQNISKNNLNFEMRSYFDFKSYFDETIQKIWPRNSNQNNIIWHSHIYILILLFNTWRVPSPS